jgi:hypothetical protein
VAFGCGTPNRLLLIPFRTFEEWMDGFWTTQREDRMYWHVRINRQDDALKLNRRKGWEDISLNQYLLGPDGVV